MSLAKFAYLLAWLSFILMVLAILYSFYVLSLPCNYDNICELPPVHLLVLLCLAVTSVINIIGMILSGIAYTDNKIVNPIAKKALKSNFMMLVINTCFAALFLFFMLL